VPQYLSTPNRDNCGKTLGRRFGGILCGYFHIDWCKLTQVCWLFPSWLRRRFKVWIWLEIMRQVYGIV